MKCKWHGGGNAKAAKGGTMVFRAVVGARPDLRTAQQNYVNMRKHRDLNRGDSLHTTTRAAARERDTLNTREAFTFSSFVVRCMCYAHLHRRPLLMVAIARSEP